MNEDEYSYGCDDKLDEEFAEKLALLIFKRGIYNPFVLCQTNYEMESRILDAMVRQYRGGCIWKTCESFTQDLIAAVNDNTINEFRKYYREASLLILTELEYLSGKETSRQEKYFLLEERMTQKRQTVFSCKNSPKEIAGLEDRILAHLYGGVVLPLDERLHILRGNQLEHSC